MIVNIPSSENLNNLALRLHFGAWADLLIMEFQFDEVYEPDGEIHWTEERTEYLKYCQPELQAIYTVIQQSVLTTLPIKVAFIVPYVGR